MVCEQCRKRPATVHYTRIVNGKKKEQYFCEQCAREQELWEWTMVEPEFSFHELLGAMFGESPFAQAQAEERRDRSMACPQCGLTFTEFRKTGTLGCGECYAAFAEQLEPILRHIHGSVQNEGKIPARAGKGIARRRQIRELQNQLEEAIRNEHFEKAAELRDRIKALQAGMAKEG